jgi:hypothetical protein
MFRMAVGHSDDVDVELALEAVFRECDSALRGATPTAGLLFSAWDQDHARLVEAVRARYPGIELAGSTTAGEMSSVIGFQEDSIALALFASDSVDVTAGLGTNLSHDPRAAAAQAVAQARSTTTQEAKLCILLPRVGLLDINQVLEAVREALGPGIPILGGGGSPEDAFGAARGQLSRQFVGDAVAEDALAILLFSGPLLFSYAVETGWHAVGPRGTVTSATPEAVLEIDGHPALDFYERYLGLREPATANPLAVYEPGSERFYLRTPTGHDRGAGSIAFFGGVPHGSSVQLTVAGIDEIFDGTRAAIAGALAAFPGDAGPDAALMFSCAVRKFVLGTRAAREIEMARDILGPGMPIAGFYCLGEIAPMSTADLSRFHNETMVALLLGTATA